MCTLRCVAHCRHCHCYHRPLAAKAWLAAHLPEAVNQHVAKGFDWLLAHTPPQVLEWGRKLAAKLPFQLPGMAEPRPTSAVGEWLLGPPACREACAAAGCLPAWHVPRAERGWGPLQTKRLLLLTSTPLGCNPLHKTPTHSLPAPQMRTGRCAVGAGPGFLTPTSTLPHTHACSLSLLSLCLLHAT